MIRSILVFLLFILLSWRASSQGCTQACACIEDVQVAAAFGWSMDSMTKTDDSFRKVSICTYRSKDDIALIRVVASTSNPNRPDQLKKKFENYLKNGEKGITYEELKSGDVQVIYGYGKASANARGTTYIIRKRLKNEKEAQIEYSSSNTPANIKSELIALIEKL